MRCLAGKGSTHRRCSTHKSVGVCGGPASATSCDVPGHVNHTAGCREYDLLLLGGTVWERVGPGLLLAAYCWHIVDGEQQALGVAAAATWLPMS